MDIGKKLKNSITPGIVIGVVVTLLAYLLNIVKIKPTALMSGIPLSTAVTSGTGKYIVSLIDGIYPVSGIATTLLWTILAGIAIIFVGTLVYNLVSPRAGKSTSSRIAYVIFYGSLPVYFIAVGGLKFVLGTLIGMALYAVVAGIAVGMAAKQFKIKVE